MVFLNAAATTREGEMRLTLRTLLAYLDDILEPSQTREIGRKIQDAPLAQELVTRIRDVVRRRRLKAPTLEGAESGVDPNVVAEYLDNQLTPPQVAQTERILLNSEMHLAEVASAHQILTLVLGEPVEVLPESRKRMYALGPVGDDEKLLVEDDPTEPAIQPSDRLAVASNGSATDAPDGGVSLTDYVKERTGTRSWWPLIGVVLLAGLFVALQWSGPGAEPVTTASKPAVVTPNQPADTNTPDDKASKTSEPAVAAASGVTPDTTTPDSTPPNQPDPVIAATEPPSDAAAGIDPAPPADVPETNPTAAVEATTVPPAMASTEQPDTTDVRTGVEPANAPDVTFVAPPGEGNDDPAMAEPPVKPIADVFPGDPPPVDKTEQPAVPKSSGNRLTYLSTGSILLRKTADAGWKLVQTDNSIGDRDRIACPKPYVAEFAVKDLPFRLILGAGSRMSTYNSTNADVGISLERGQVVLSRRMTPKPAEPPKEDATEAPKAAPLSDKPATIELEIADQHWIVTLPAAESRIAFDVTPVPPIRLDKTTDGFPFKVWAVGGTGAVTVKAADGDAKTVGSQDRIALAGPEPGTVLVEPGGAGNWVVEKDPVAKWLAGPVAPTEKRDAVRFANEFDPVDSISDTMPVLIRHERSWMARRAVQCLSLTNDYRALVRTLSVAEHDEALAEAIHGLRDWLPSNPANGEMLKAALEQEFTAEDSIAIYQLLWGFDEGHAQNPKTSRELVRWLSHDRPAVRRLAYFHILRLTGNQDEYKANLSKDRMTSFRKRWERQIEKHGKLL